MYFILAHFSTPILAVSILDQVGLQNRDFQKYLLSPLPILYHLCYVVYIHVLFMLYYIHVTLCCQIFIKYCHINGRIFSELRINESTDQEAICIESFSNCS